MNRRRFLRGVVMGGVGVFAAPMLNLGRCRVFADDGMAGGGPLRSVRAVDLMTPRELRAAATIRQFTIALQSRGGALQFRFFDPPDVDAAFAEAASIAATWQLGGPQP